ncbi:PhzF family phenazine biosynthesis protein [Laceyella putida]|uniref:PhzF family phenazine biosynthesis protein n=1 Tax=Laceyella putida TaxID=110101 RepID=A0ABW2RHQ2_9BACL
MKMSIPLFQVDAFTNEPFKGNPAGVCILPHPQAEDWMQQLASEMNLAETAFLYPEADGYRLRWFTPTTEVDLCGHATLASAHILWEQGYLASDQVARFYTKSGQLIAKRKKNGIQLDFPAVAIQLTEIPHQLIALLGDKVQQCLTDQANLVVVLKSEADVRQLQLHRDEILAIPGLKNGVIFTALGTELDFVSRCFFPQVGIDEDPVTGSAHCLLGPYWGQVLSKTTLTAYQASPRGGELRIDLNGQRVHLTGQAVTIFKAECLV